MKASLAALSACWFPLVSESAPPEEQAYNCAVCNPLLFRRWRHYLEQSSAALGKRNWSSIFSIPCRVERPRQCYLVRLARRSGLRADAAPL
jgi:hypothetical protein